MNLSYNKQLFPFEAKWININGNQIHYIDEGKGQIILFTHAPLASAFMFREMITVLSKNYRCIAIDFPGFGLSKAKKGYLFNIISQSEILSSFIQKLSLTEIILLGHDTGGPSGFLTATKYPELFKGIILTDTIIFPVKEYPRIFFMLSMLNSFPIRWLNRQTNFLVKVTFRFGVMTRKVEEIVKKQYYQLFKNKKQRDQIIDLLCSLKDSSQALSEIKKGFENQLNHLPSLLIYGDKDPVYEMGIPQRMTKMLPDSELKLIFGEGHFPHEARGVEMAEIITNWITEKFKDENLPTYRESTPHSHYEERL